MNDSPLDSHCSNEVTVSLQHNDLARQNHEYWGDSLEHATDPAILRIATININGLPKHTSHAKNGMIRESIAQYKLIFWVFQRLTLNGIEYILPTDLSNGYPGGGNNVTVATHITTKIFPPQSINPGVLPF